MRRSVILMASSLTACGPASSSIAPGPELPPRVQVTSGGVDVRLDGDERVVGDVVPVSMDAAWDALVAVYGQHGFPIELRDPTRRVIATASFRAPRQLMDRRLGSFIDCGQSFTGPRVSTWRVSARLVSAVDSTSDGAAVRSRLTASARPRDGTSTPPVPCTSSGELEREIVRRVRDRASGG